MATVFSSGIAEITFVIGFCDFGVTSIEEGGPKTREIAVKRRPDVRHASIYV